MSILATDYADKYGLDADTKEAYGAKTQLQQENRSLKQYRNVVAPSPDTATPNPGGSVAQPQVPAVSPPGSAPTKPPPSPERGFGPSSGLGTEPGSAPAVGGTFRGMGPSANIVPPGQEGVPNAPPGTQLPSVLTKSAADALVRMAAMPNASPIIRLYARIASQQYRGGV